MLDETIITETPLLYSCYGRIGQQGPCRLAAVIDAGFCMGQSMSGRGMSLCW
jgi:hypothetical protein